MTDEELKELEFAIHCKYSTKRDFIEKTCSKLIKQEQSRRAVTDEEVNKAIKWIESKRDFSKNTDDGRANILCLQALRQKEESEQILTLAAKLNVIDLVIENLRISNSLRHCRSDVIIMQSKLYALNQMKGWIPCSDRLPYSGEHVLLGCEVRPSKRKYVCDGYYAATKTIESTNSDECATEYDEDKDEYFLLEGFYEVIKNWDDFSSVVISDFVTHWMPLPLPPKEEI